MSTSPSWFDKDKFSRLVKKPGPKGGAIHPLPSAGTASQRLVSPILLKKAEVQAGTPEKKEGEPLPDHPVSSENSVAEAPVQSEPGPVAPDSAAKAFSKQNMMTSQPLSMGSIHVEPLPSVPVSIPAPEPIRAPTEISPAKAPSLESPLPTLPRRTAPLPALKSIFQYEISAVGKAPSLTSALKSSPPPLRADHSEDPRKSTPPLPKSEEKSGVAVSGQLAQSSEDLASAWEKIAQLNEDLRKAGRDRDQAVNENGLLREQLKLADEEQKAPKPDENLSKIIRERDALKAKVEDIGHAMAERDQVRGEYRVLREQFETLKQDQLRGRNEANAGLTQQLEVIRQQLTERDQEVESLRADARGIEENLHGQLITQSQEIDGLKTTAQAMEADLRKQLDERGKEIESYKSQSSQSGGVEEDLRRQLTERSQEIDGLKTAAQATEADLRKQLDECKQEIESSKAQAGGADEDLRRQLTEKEKEIETAKANSTGLQDTVESLKKELTEVQDQLKKAQENAPSATALQEQIAQAKEEVSTSQRGLALSQKALQETRDVLQEAQEALAQSKVSLENLKKENSTLVQQNMLFQAQNDQISRELSAAKAKRAAKG